MYCGGQRSLRVINMCLILDEVTKNVVSQPSDDDEDDDDLDYDDAEASGNGPISY